MNENLDYKYVDNKSDKTILFLHGWGMNKNSFDRVIVNLTNECNILCLDFFGFGGSSEPTFSYDTYEYAYHIFMLLKKLNINKIYLVGHSFGGRVAIILSAIFKIDIWGMVLTSSAGLNKFSLKKYIKIKMYKLKKWLSNCGIINKEKLKKCGSSDYQKLSNKMKSCFVKIVNQDLTFLLKKITCKTYLVWCKKDKETPVWICNKMFRLIKQSKKIFYKKGGHFAYFYNVAKFALIINNMTTII